jgi:trimethylamine--corrinoid protein Co-methyltransferase
VIDQVGPAGNFVGVAHTLEHYREHWYPTLFERRSWSEWYNAGAKDLFERAVEKAEQILADHKVPPLPEEVCRELDEIVGAAEKRAGVR